MTWGDPGRILLTHDWETAYGVAPSAASAYTLPYEEENFGVDDNPIETEVLGNGNPSMPARGNKDANATIRVPFDLDAIGFWLKGLIGSPTTTGSIAPYTHVFKYAAGVLPSAIVDMGHPDLTLYYKYNKVMVNTMDFSFGGNNPLSISVGLVCGTETKGTSPYQASPTDISHNYTRLDNPDVSAITEGGGAITNIEQFNIKADNQLDSSFALGGSGWRTRSTRTKMKVTGNIVATFEDDSLLLKGRNNTESALSLTLTSGSYSVVFHLEELKYGQRRSVTRGRQGLRIDLPFVAYYANGSNASAFKTTLVNTRAAAYYA